MYVVPHASTAAGRAVSNRGGPSSHAGGRRRTRSVVVRDAYTVASAAVSESVGMAGWEGEGWGVCAVRWADRSTRTHSLACIDSAECAGSPCSGVGWCWMYVDSEAEMHGTAGQSRPRPEADVQILHRQQNTAAEGMDTAANEEVEDE